MCVVACCVCVVVCCVVCAGCRCLLLLSGLRCLHVAVCCLLCVSIVGGGRVVCMLECDWLLVQLLRVYNVLFRGACWLLVGCCCMSVVVCCLLVLV